MFSTPPRRPTLPRPNAPIRRKTKKSEYEICFDEILKEHEEQVQADNRPKAERLLQSLEDKMGVIVKKRIMPFIAKADQAEGEQRLYGIFIHRDTFGEWIIYAGAKFFFLTKRK